MILAIALYDLCFRFILRGNLNFKAMGNPSVASHGFTIRSKISHYFSLFATRVFCVVRNLIFRIHL